MKNECRERYKILGLRKIATMNMESYPGCSNEAAAGAAGGGGSRKRSATASSRAGVYRSVLDYQTEDELRAAMLTAQGGGGNGNGLLMGAEINEMILAIQDGQPVQKV
jgi:hypothetical protein